MRLGKNASGRFREGSMEILRRWSGRPPKAPNPRNGASLVEEFLAGLPSFLGACHIARLPDEDFRGPNPPPLYPPSSQQQSPCFPLMRLPDRAPTSCSGRGQLAIGPLRHRSSPLARRLPRTPYPTILFGPLAFCGKSASLRGWGDLTPLRFHGIFKKNWPGPYALNP